jgi:hypothetical protein
MGSPDIRQIDGLGGASSVTSKAAILSPSGENDADVDYTFAQVSVDKPAVSLSLKLFSQGAPFLSRFPHPGATRPLHDIPALW